MKPENELQAEEVAFVNTCRHAFERLKESDRGRHHVELFVLNEHDAVVATFSSLAKKAPPPPPVASADTDEIDDTVEELRDDRRDVEAKLPTVPPPKPKKGK